MCRECGQSIVEASQYFDENPPETTSNDKDTTSLEDGDAMKLPYAKKGDVDLKCAWCGATRKDTKRIFNVRLIYEIDEKGERVFFFSGIGDGAMSVFLPDNNPVLVGTVFSCEACGEKASRLS